MSKAGFDLPFDSSAGAGSRASLIGVNGLFTSEDAAKAIGYPTTRKDALPPLDLYESKLPTSAAAKFSDKYRGANGSPVETITLSGGTKVSSNTTGCYADANRAVYGSVKDALKLENFVNEINAEAAKYVNETADTLRGPVGSYEACMQKAGDQVRGLRAEDLALNRFGKYRTAAQPPSVEEQNLAVADYRCQQSAKLTQTLNKQFLKKSSIWIINNEGLIIATRDLLDASAARAKSIINGS